MSDTTGMTHMYLPKDRGRLDEGGQVETGNIVSQWRDRGGVKDEWRRVDHSRSLFTE